MSDHTFIHAIVKRAVESYRAKGPGYAMVIEDEGWLYDEGLGVSVKKEPN
jgi:hypothetical protein